MKNRQERFFITKALLMHLQNVEVSYDDSLMKACLFFDGTLESSFVLHFLLNHTKLSVKVYFPDLYFFQKKYEEQEAINIYNYNIDILEYAKQKHRDFESAEFVIENDSLINMANQGDIVRYHINSIQNISSLVGEFDYYFITANPFLLNDQSFSRKLEADIKNLNSSVEIVSIIESFSAVDFIMKVLLSTDYYMFNISYLMAQYSILKSVYLHEDITNILISYDEANLAYVMWCHTTDFTVETNLEFLLLNNEIIDHRLHYIFLEEVSWKGKIPLVIYISTILKISTVDLFNIFLQKNIDNNDYVVAIGEVSEFLQYFYNSLHVHQLFQLVDKLSKAFAEYAVDIFDIFVDYKFDIGEYLIYLLYLEDHDASFVNFFLYILDNYIKYISVLQLQEILLRSFLIKAYPICNKLNKLGLKNNILQQHHYKNYTTIASEDRYNSYITSKPGDNNLNVKVLKLIMQELGDPHKKLSNVIILKDNYRHSESISMFKKILTYKEVKFNVIHQLLSVRFVEDIIIQGHRISEAKLYSHLLQVMEVIEKVIELSQMQAYTRSNDYKISEVVLKYAIIINLIASEEVDINLIEVIAHQEYILSSVFGEDQKSMTLIANIDDLEMIVQNKLIESYTPVIVSDERLSIMKHIVELEQANSYDIISIANKDYSLLRKEGWYVLRFNQRDYNLVEISHCSLSQVKIVASILVCLLLDSKVTLSAKSIPRLLAHVIDKNYSCPYIKTFTSNRLHFSAVYFDKTYKVMECLFPLLSTTPLYHFINLIETHYSDFTKCIILEISGDLMRLIGMIKIIMNKGGELLDRIYIVYNNINYVPDLEKFIPHYYLDSKVIFKQNLSSALTQAKKYFNLFDEERKKFLAIVRIDNQYKNVNLSTLIGERNMGNTYVEDLHFAYTNRFISDVQYKYMYVPEVENFYDGDDDDDNNQG